LLFGRDGGQNVVGKVDHAGFACAGSAVGAGDNLRREGVEVGSFLLSEELEIFGVYRGCRLGVLSRLCDESRGERVEKQQAECARTLGEELATRGFQISSVA
jgi:hypothetical protein